MAKHRRYPVKKTKKIKSKDSYERMGNNLVDKKRKNLVPKKDELDNQPLTRKWLDIQEASKEAAKPRTRSGKKRAKNKFYEMTAKMGFQKRPWENDVMLANRVMRAKNRALDDELIRVKTGTAGRDLKEIDADMKELDEKERRKKLLKVAAAEKRRKLKEKEERFRQSQLAKHADDSDDFEPTLNDDESDGEDEDIAEDGDADEQEAIQARVVRKATSKRTQKKEKQKDPDAKKRLTSNEKSRQKKKEDIAERKRFLMLNAREIIPFGERVDAPPEFAPILRKKFDSLYSQAGKKDLLLKDLLQPRDRNLYTGSLPVTDPQDEVRVTDEERQRYIEAYRKLKLNKN